MPVPDGVVLFKAPSSGVVFASWPNGLIRHVTLAEYTLWGKPTPQPMDNSDLPYFNAYAKAVGFPGIAGL